MKKELLGVHISELSRKTGVSLRSLRYYEEKELLCPERLNNGYREYRETDIERVRLIQMHFSLGLTVKEIMSFFNARSMSISKSNVFLTPLRWEGGSWMTSSCRWRC